MLYMVSRTAEEWYHITRRQFDPSGLLHLATDRALHSIFTSLLNGCEQAKEQGRLQEPSPHVRVTVAEFQCLKNLIPESR